MNLKKICDYQSPTTFNIVTENSSFWQGILETDGYFSLQELQC